jgi:hypothetical protein
VVLFAAVRVGRHLRFQLLRHLVEALLGILFALEQAGFPHPQMFARILRRNFQPPGNLIDGSCSFNSRRNVQRRVSSAKAGNALMQTAPVMTLSHILHLQSGLG